MVLGLSLAGCVESADPAEVEAYVDRTGLVIGAADGCQPRLAARAAACARNTVATWPGGMDDDFRLSALRRLDDVRAQAAGLAGTACPKAVEALRRSEVWRGCYWSGAS